MTRLTLPDVDDLADLVVTARPGSPVVSFQVRGESGGVVHVERADVVELMILLGSWLKATREMANTGSKS